VKHYRSIRPRVLVGLTLVVFSLTASACLSTTTTTTTSISTSTPSPSSRTGLHYAPNGDFSGNTYLLGAYGFNLADIGDMSQVNALPAGVKGLVYLGLCAGVTSAFTTAVQPYVGNQKVFGFYLMDEPNPSSCTAANLKAESDWIHANDPGTKTLGSTRPILTLTYTVWILTRAAVNSETRANTGGLVLRSMQRRPMAYRWPTLFRCTRHSEVARRPTTAAVRTRYLCLHKRLRF
jgi:hypothetical protein